VIHTAKCLGLSVRREYPRIVAILKMPVPLFRAPPGAAGCVDLPAVAIVLWDAGFTRRTNANEETPIALDDQSELRLTAGPNPRRRLPDALAARALAVNANRKQVPA
jgi:hypothetical protein